MDHSYLFSLVSETGAAQIVFFDAKTKQELFRKAFPTKNRVGKVFRLALSLEELKEEAIKAITLQGGTAGRKELLYQFQEGDQRFPDPRGRAFVSNKKYGQEKLPSDVYTVLEVPEFDWKGSENPQIPYENSLIYCMHVRGFTKHASSGVSHRGTFRGVAEKIPYLKEIGVTTLEFQPIYEFIEKPARVANQVSSLCEAKVNYWGYVQGYYLAPKADYAAGEATFECKEMIRALHDAGMEAVLQFYFPAQLNPMSIPEILHYWVEEYHVDGFHLIGENLPSELLAKDPELSETKLWYYHMDAPAIYGRHEVPKYKNLALLRDDFMYEVRRFLKGDEGLVPQLMQRIREVPESVGKINYLTTYWGFTLMDMVSYDFKHNEANGEENHDGTDYNCSWNCGEEGPSKKKKVQRLRMAQMKNALCLLLFAQGTPRIFMGDEFGNTQKGNNNPYCQDNEVTWLNWKNVEKHKELFEFFKLLVKLRKENAVLRPGTESGMMDSIACGYPELSFHGETAWKPQFESYGRQLGVLYCGLYARKKGEEYFDEKKSYNFLYLAVNAHWESHRLALPRLPKGMRWELLFATSDAGAEKEPALDHVTLSGKTTALYVSAVVKGFT